MSALFEMHGWKFKYKKPWTKYGTSYPACLEARKHFSGTIGGSNRTSYPGGPASEYAEVLIRVYEGSGGVAISMNGTSLIDYWELGKMREVVSYMEDAMDKELYA